MFNYVSIWLPCIVTKVSTQGRQACRVTQINQFPSLSHTHTHNLSPPLSHTLPLSQKHTNYLSPPPPPPTSPTSMKQNISTTPPPTPSVCVCVSVCVCMCMHEDTSAGIFLSPCNMRKTHCAVHNHSTITRLLTSHLIDGERESGSTPFPQHSSDELCNVLCAVEAPLLVVRHVLVVLVAAALVNH